MPIKMAVMLDGGHVRVHARSAGKTYDPAYIEKIGLACASIGETIHRIMYYDCAPYNGTAILPVSGQRTTFTGSDAWLKALSYKDLFSVRLGVLKFRGYVMNNNRIPYTPGQPLTDADFHPEFEQKGVDMRIGMDIANLSSNRSVDLIALATNDTDCIPAMKHARRSGLQVALITFPGYQPVPELLALSLIHISIHEQRQKQEQAAKLRRELARGQGELAAIGDGSGGGMERGGTFGILAPGQAGEAFIV